MDNENIKYDPRNYRIHGEENKRLINKSLAECGAGRSIVVDRDDVIISGNGVYEQAQALGLKVRIIESDGNELIAIKRVDLATDDEKRKLLSFADNRTSDTSSFDFSLLVEDFEVNLPDWGLLSDEIDSLTEDADSKIPEDLTAPRRKDPPYIKIAFIDMKQAELFEKEMKPLIEKFDGASYVFGGGEL